MRQKKWFLWVASLALLRVSDAGAAPITIYSTAFEVAEGYDARFTLVGQRGWLGKGSGGNGLFSETGGFPGLGQQAYVGAFEPTAGPEDFLAVWRPINLAPVPSDTPIVKFSVQMEIIDSDNDRFDCFRWIVYNTNVDRLLTLDFDNFDLTINYRLGTNAFIFTGQTYTPNVRYQLVVTMDFVHNLWSATLDNTSLLMNQPFNTTPGVSINLGDIDALWVYNDPDAPGNNLMVFDNYQITREAVSDRRPFLVNLGHIRDSSHLLRLYGEAGRRYAIEGATDLGSWTALRTNTADNGEFDFADTLVRGSPRRFYRARLVP